MEHRRRLPHVLGCGDGVDCHTAALARSSCVWAPSTNATHRGVLAGAASIRHRRPPRPDRQPSSDGVDQGVLAGACASTPGPAGAARVRGALTHLLGFGRTEEGLGLSEGGLGCCTRCVAGGCGVVGHGSHRSTLPQPLLRTSRAPRRRCSHRWDVSFPRTTPYQNALRMSRGGARRRETRARRRRDRAERLPESSAWRRWPEAVPGQRAPKREHPRA